MKTIILLSAYKGSGKNTVANIITDLDNSFVSLSFAKALKDNVKNNFYLGTADLEDQKLKEQPILDLKVEPKGEFATTLVDSVFSSFRDESGFPPKNKNYISAWLNRETLYWTPRALMILEGQVARAVDVNHWTDKVISQAKYFNKIVIPDFRFPSEVERIKEVLGSQYKIITVRINRFDNKPNDLAERDLDNFKFDYYLDNRGSLNELQIKVEELLDTIYRS